MYVSLFLDVFCFFFKGIQLIQDLINEYGLVIVQNYMGYIQVRYGLQKLYNFFSLSYFSSLSFVKMWQVNEVISLQYGI